MKKTLLLCLLLPQMTTAQPYTKAKTRHRFAQLNLGADVCFYPGNGTQSYRQSNSGNLQSFRLNNQTETRFIIGGTHFWGHADFFLAFKVAGFGNSGFSSFVETGGKYFPWRIQDRKLRPYIGISWLPTIYRQGGGALHLKNQYPLTAGIVWNKRNHLVELNAAYLYNNTRDYYITTFAETPVKTPALRFGIGYKFMLETTLSAEKNWQSGRTKRITDTLAKRKKLNGFTLAAGASTAVLLKASPHTANAAPYADQYKIANVFPEWGIGYYFHKPDIQINAAYRRVRSQLEAYDFYQSFTRKALTIEAYKFFADYHGFAPFVGPSLSYERLSICESISTINREGNYQGLKPGITAGWDIRPDRLQSWYLRTNIRWFPNLDVKMYSGKNVSLDQLEINFIQLVVFPGRLF